MQSLISWAQKIVRCVLLTHRRRQKESLTIIFTALLCFQRTQNNYTNSAVNKDIINQIYSSFQMITKLTNNSHMHTRLPVLVFAQPAKQSTTLIVAYAM